MKTLGLAVALVVLASGLVLATGACGSGGTPPPPPVDPLSFFSGTYFLMGWLGDDGAPDEATSQWGTISADGAGMIIGGMTTRNINEVISAPGAITPFPYTVDALGRMTWSIGGMDAFLGGVSEDGRTALIGSIFAGIDPGVFLMVKREGTFNNASLNGVYQVCRFFFNPPALDGTNYSTTITFDGAGVATSNGGDRNFDGAIGSFGASPPGAYTVMADGTVTFDFGSQVAEGGVLFGGELIISAGGSMAGDVPDLVVLIREGAGLSNATLAGSYHGVGLESDNGGAPQWRSRTFTATADGAGGLSVAAGTQNNDGVISAIGAFAEAYAVAANGVLTVSGGALLGAVSQSGRAAAFAGGTMAADDPSMFILFRK